MAINTFLGTAPAVAQVDTFTPGGTIEADDIFILTVSGFDGSSLVVSAAAGGTAATDVVTALKAAWVTSQTTGSLTENITASGTATLILTADTAGVEFKVVGTTTEAGGGAADDQTFIRAATTANAGPNSWDDANNWSEGTIPGATAGEDTVIENSSVDILYGLNQSGAAETLTTLRFKRTYTGLVGWNGGTGLVGDYLQVKATKAFIGGHFASGNPSGSGRIKIDFGSTQATVIQYFMATSADSPKPAFRMLADNAATIIQEIRKGSAGVAQGTGETSTIGSALISFDTNRSPDASLEIGSGTTITTVTGDGGETYVFAAATTITSNGGTLTTAGTGAVTNLIVAGGSVESSSTGTVGTCTITKGGTCDFTKNAEARTVTTLTLDDGVLQYDKAIVTITSKVEPGSNGRTQLRASSI